MEMSYLLTMQGDSNLYTNAMNSEQFQDLIPKEGQAIFELFATNDDFDTIKYLAEGEENYIYKISGEKAIYVARILKPGNIRTELDYRFEFEFQDYLRKNNIPIPKHYPTVSNELYATYTLSGQRTQITLHDFVQGNIVTEPSTKHIEAAAKLLGDMHRLAQRVDLSYDRLEDIDALSWLNDITKTPASGELEHRAAALYRDYGSYIKDNLKKLKKVPLHNDIHFGNLLFNKTSLVAALDFDESHKHYIPLELGWSMGQICNFGDFESFKDNLAIFKKTYDSQYQLSELEESLVEATLITETSRKFLKNLTNPNMTQQFSNVLEWEKTKHLPAARTLTTSTDERSGTK